MEDSDFRIVVFVCVGFFVEFVGLGFLETRREDFTRAYE